MKRRILVVTGGTGGHLFPAQSLAKTLLENDSMDVLFIGGGLSKNKWFDTASFSYVEVSAAPISLKNFFRFCINTVKGFVKSIYVLLKYRPHMVIGFGSFHTFPTLLAVRLMRKKLYIHEQNIKVGRVNQFFARFATKIFISFPTVTSPYLHKSVYVKMPLKFEKKEGLTQQEARASLSLNPYLKTVLVCGGSQGAQTINQLAVKCFPMLKETSFQVIHLAGFHDDILAIKQAYLKANIGAIVQNFNPNIHVLMRASNFMISRAGASTLSEMIELELPAILIPYPHAQAHQNDNASFVQNHVKGGVTVYEKGLKENHFTSLLVEFFKDENIQQYIDNIKSYKRDSLAGNCAKIIQNDLELI